MLYQLANGKVIYLTVDQYLDLTDLDIQYLISQNSGNYIANPFADSAITTNSKDHSYDFDYQPDDEISDNESFDDPIDLSNL